MKTKTPMSIKLTPDFSRRLQEAADRTRIKKHLLAELAIESAVEAIEANGFRIVMPIRFAVEDVPDPQSAKAAATAPAPAPGPVASGIQGKVQTVADLLLRGTVAKVKGARGKASQAPLKAHE